MAKKDAEMIEIKAQMAAMAKIINCIQQPTDRASASAAVTPTLATRGRGHQEEVKLEVVVEVVAPMPTHTVTLLIGT